MSKNIKVERLLKQIKEITPAIENDKNQVELSKQQLEENKKLLSRSEALLQHYRDNIDHLLRDGEQDVIIDKTEMEGCYIKTVKAPPAVIVTDESKLSEEFINTKTTVDKKLLKLALLEGELEGAHMREEQHNLVIEVK